MIRASGTAAEVHTARPSRMRQLVPYAAEEVEIKQNSDNRTLCQFWLPWGEGELLLSPDLMPNLYLSFSRAFMRHVQCQSMGLLGPLLNGQRKEPASE